jgi:arsenite methyltransferase
MFQSYFSRQLAKPSGIFGRLFTARWLEKANVGMNALTLGSLVLRENDRLLEVGFGSGYLLEHALSEHQCGYVAGVDVSREMVEHVSHRLRRYVKAGKADIRQSDIELMPFADNEFTALCSVNTLYFWRDPARALVECRRVLEPAGRLALCFNSKHALEQWPGHVHVFSLYELSEVETLLAAAGFFRIVTRTGHDKAQGEFHCLTAVAA